MSAGRLGILACFLPADLRAEATAALLAWRMLSAYEGLNDRRRARGAVVTAVGYLNGDTETPPPPLQAIAVRDVRALLLALPIEGRKRVGRMLVDVGQVMAHNLDSPLSRTAYGEGVLGRVVLYVCSLVAEHYCAETDLSELAGCIGVTAQLANDLRSNELALYGTRDREELTRAVMLRLLAPALGSLALLARLGPSTPSRGVRAAMAYLTITTTAYFCTAVGAPTPYRRSLRLVEAVRAAQSPVRWTIMLERVRRSADGAIHQLLGASPKPVAEAGPANGSGPAADVLGLGDLRSMSPSMGPLLVAATFALVEALPEEPLTGELPHIQVRRMMIADHLAFGALERLPIRDVDAMRSLAMQFQLRALDTAGQGEAYDHEFDPPDHHVYAQRPQNPVHSCASSSAQVRIDASQRLNPETNVGDQVRGR